MPEQQRANELCCRAEKKVWMLLTNFPGIFKSGKFINCINKAS